VLAAGTLSRLLPGGSPRRAGAASVAQA
jgi:hypothetical protein